ncbi:putative Zn-dependent peptidase [Desulfuromonas soudanensis]|uniref:Putative Zn-dependent peptidase n=1 Tax=Desulfuromonas soudanensis TaxID=1603606 RepID=A0A0M4D394_9BACT|nr:pitrilysin family protein [Desulfuromonas soudanensis]ALC17890.1 putative Zn-dependent peptidase [Desulfuromonas soudanensis]
MSEFYRDTLANGLRVVTVEMPHLHSAEMVCYVRAGGRHETATLAGISHFLEHIVFRGTTDYPSSFELERAFEEIGGAVNASTDSEITCFHSRLHPSRLAEGAALFASMLLRPRFAEVELERRIILEEALEDVNQKGEEISPDNLTARMLWPDHPLGMPTIGTRESISRITEGDLRAYHAARYSPAETVVAVTGNLKRAEAVAAVAAAFGDWAQAARQSEIPVPPSREETTAQATWVRDSDSQVNVQFAFRMPGRRDRRSVALRVLRFILSWGGTSRLMLRLRETLGLTYSVEANLSLFEECGCFTIDLSLAPNNLVQAVREVLAIVEDLCTKPAGDEELQRVVRSYRYDLDFSRDHTEDMSVRYGWGELVDHLRTLEQDRKDIAAITPTLLLETARSLFLPGDLKLAVVGPFRAADRKAVEKILEGFRKQG